MTAPSQLRWWQFQERAACPHSDLRPIYGDEILFGTPRLNRLQCRPCGRFLSGHVVLAKMRAGEVL